MLWHQFIKAILQLHLDDMIETLYFSHHAGVMLGLHASKRVQTGILVAKLLGCAFYIINLITKVVRLASGGGGAIFHSSVNT